MSKRIIEDSTLKTIADAIRSLNQTDKKYTPEEMAAAVRSILDDTTYVFEDLDGTQVVGVIAENDVVFTATANDIRKGTIAAGAEGIIEGTKEIPSYHTNAGYKIVTNGSKFVVDLNYYDYTNFQALVCPYNTNIANSVATEKVVIDNHVYPVQSTVSESAISIDTANKRIDFGITNTSGSKYLIRYFTYKEIY